jgi:hypothetical protein
VKTLDGLTSLTRWALLIPFTLLRVIGAGNAETTGSPSPDVGVWRFSVDNKGYTIQTVGGHLIIKGVRSGAVSADLPIKMQKKGREIVMGQWQNGPKEGFILVKEITAERVSAFVFVPLDPLQPKVCRTRTSAFLANVAAANQHMTVCGSMVVNWIRDQDLTAEQAVEQEVKLEQEQTYQSVSRASDDATTPIVRSSSTRCSTAALAGEWRGNAVTDSPFVTSLDFAYNLSADGTYSYFAGQGTLEWVSHSGHFILRDIEGPLARSWACTITFQPSAQTVRVNSQLRYGLMPMQARNLLAERAQTFRIKPFLHPGKLLVEGLSVGADDIGSFSIDRMR